MIDRARLTPEQRELVRVAAPMAKRVARTVAARFPGARVDDLTSVGHEALIDASRRYDPASEVPFDKFAFLRVRGEILDAAKHEARRWAREGRSAPGDWVSSFEDAPDVLRETDQEASSRLERFCDGAVAAMVIGQTGGLGGEDDLVARESFARATSALGAAVRGLPERDARILSLKYDEGRDLHAVARELGVSYPTAKRYHASAIARLAAELRAAGVSKISAT